MSEVVFVLGGSSGIGLETVKKFINEKAIVFNGSRTQCPVAGVTNFTVDVSNPKTITDAVEKILSEYGKIDIGIYCAGISIAAPADKTTREDYSYLFEVNMFGAAEFVRAVTPVMKAHNKGKLLFVSSLAGELPVPFEAYYSSSKAALDAYVTELNIELNQYNIYATSIVPGGVRTEFTQKRKIYSDGEQIQNLNNATQTLAAIEQQGLNAQKVAEAIYNQAHKKRPDIICVVGFKNKVQYAISRVLPQKASVGVIKYMYKQDNNGNGNARV
ncbi:MAG TPA: SDR family NAD(P)-dependent oxidoreductase [Clostridia bacterium]